MWAPPPATGLARRDPLPAGSVVRHGATVRTTPGVVACVLARDGIAMTRAAVDIGVRAGAAIGIAEHFRMNELWVGLSVLAIGAALPELATAVVAAHRGHGNVVVGSAVASSVVNLLLVVGLLALGRPFALSTSLLHVEIPALIAFALAFFPMIRGDAVVSRREGLVLVLAFAGWVAWLLYPRF